MNSRFYQYCSGCVFYYRRITRKAEAGRGGILRSINRSATCPAMWRLTFSGGGHLVRLSANICQLHRPNTIPIFCAAVCRDYRLRTFIGFNPKFLNGHDSKDYTKQQHHQADKVVRRDAEFHVVFQLGSGQANCQVSSRYQRAYHKSQVLTDQHGQRGI